MRTLVLILLLLLSVPARAQDSNAGFLTHQVEQALSGEGRTVRLNGVSGLLSSSATVKEITVADTEGVWLRISGAAIDWTRLDLLRGRLTVNTLAAERIEVLRTPASDLSVTAEAPTIAIPVLPVVVNIREFRIGELIFSHDVFGLASTLSADGNLAMVNGGLDLSLSAERLDQPGQALLDVTYDAAADMLDFNLDLSEPPGGMVANALNLADEPAVELRLAGTGPVAGLDLTLSMRIGDAERVSGAIHLNRDGGLLGMQGALTAEIGELVSGPAKAILDGPVRLEFDARRRETDWEISSFRFGTGTLAVSGTGVASAQGFDGSLDFSTTDLGVLAPLAGTALEGQAEFGLQGRIGFPNGDFDLAISGEANNLLTGIAALDGVLKGQTRVSGRVQRDTQGVQAKALRLEGAAGSVTLDGDLASDDVNARIVADLADIADLGVPAAGPARLNLTLSGAPSSPEITGTARLAEVTLNGRELRNAEVFFDGVLADGGFKGLAAAGVAVAGLPVRVSGRLVASPAALTFSEVVGQAASLNLNGNLSFAAESGLRGDLTGSLGDLSDFSELAGSELSGQAELIGVSLRPGSALSLTAFMSDVAAFGLQAGDAGLRAELNGGSVSATVSARSVVAGGLALTDLRLTGSGDTAGQVFELTAAGPGQTALAIKAGLAGGEGARELTVTSATLRTTGGEVSLIGSSLLKQIEGGFTLSPTSLQAGTGKAKLGGTFGTQSNATLELAAVPLSLVQAYLPQSVPQGPVTGTVSISGPLTAPLARFDLSATGLTVPGAQTGFGTIGVSASGTASRSEIQLERFAATGAAGLALTGSGKISLAGGPMDLTAEGKVPLGLVGAFSAGRFEASGTATVNLRARGTTARPDLQGEVRVAGATFTDFSSNLRLNQVDLAASFTGSDLVISSASARSSAGGGLTATGRVGFAGGRLTPNITLDLRNLAWADGRTIYARLSGQLALRPSGGGSLLSGDLVLGETIIVIPENTVGLSARGIPDIIHHGQSSAVQATLDRVQATMPQQGSVDFVSRLSVDITVSAPGHIFVRGRGLDAEMRGNIRITGPVSDVSPVGSFQMIRGRLDFLARRFEFSEGRITMQGNFDPVLAFRAEARSADVLVLLSLTGSASDPEFTLSSSPELPQDEVLARLIFDRGFGDLTTAQTIQLAAAVRELNGGRDSGVFSRIRRATNLDDLDLGTDEEGSLRVRAGKYIDDNIYLDVEARSRGETRATISLELNADFTAKATAGTDGETSVGVFFEKDY